MKDPTERFSGRAAAYVRSRPGYPTGILDRLRSECGLTPAWLIADIGSGTGLLTQIFLDHGNRVMAVEPNGEMRSAAEVLLGQRSNFVSLDGMAEATTLADDSVDLIVAGQAFHWFDHERARPEFERILKAGGWVALVWNDRDLGSTGFMRAYEDLLEEYGTDYPKVHHDWDDEEPLRQFFEPHQLRSAVFPNRQEFDFPGVRDRLLSASYSPQSGEPRFQEMLARLRRIFDEHEDNGRVHFLYKTRMYYGTWT